MNSADFTAFFELANNNIAIAIYRKLKTAFPTKLVFLSAEEIEKSTLQVLRNIPEESFLHHIGKLKTQCYSSKGFLYCLESIYFFCSDVYFVLFLAKVRTYRYR